MPKRDFEKLLIQAVDEGLSSLGESSRHAVYFYLEKKFDLKKQEIPDKIKIFANAIEKIFGSGADFLEVLIMKNLYEKVGGILKLRESNDFTFVEYVMDVKRNFAGEKRVTSKEKALKEAFNWQEVEV